MTLTPRDWALASMAAPEPESRFTSRSTFAPFVICFSGCCCLVDLSPCALSIVTGTPAALKAACSSGRSKDSQRTDDFVSGSSTPTFWALPPPVVDAPPPDVDALSSSPPHAAIPNDRAQRAPPMASTLREIGECITVLLLLWNGTCWGLGWSVGHLTRGRRGPAPRGARHGRRASPRRSRGPPRRPGSRSGAPPRAAARAGRRRRR